MLIVFEELLERFYFESSVSHCIALTVVQFLFTDSIKRGFKKRDSNLLHRIRRPALDHSIRIFWSRPTWRQKIFKSKFRHFHSEPKLNLLLFSILFLFLPFLRIVKLMSTYVQVQQDRPSGNGVMDKALACRAGGRGSIPEVPFIQMKNICSGIRW